MSKYLLSILLMLILLIGCSGQTDAATVITDEDRIVGISEVQEVRPGMSWEDVYSLLGAPYESIMDGEVNKISYKLENDVRYVIQLKQTNSKAYVNAIGIYGNLTPAYINSRPPYYESSYSQWKLIWPDVSRASEVQPGMTVEQVEALLGLPQRNVGFGLIRKVYYLSGGYSARIYYTYTENESMPVASLIDIEPLSMNTNSDYYLITAANIIVPMLIVILAIIIFVFYKRRRTKKL